MRILQTMEILPCASLEMKITRQYVSPHAAWIADDFNSITLLKCILWLTFCLGISRYENYQAICATARRFNCRSLQQRNCPKFHQIPPPASLCRVCIRGWELVITGILREMQFGRRHVVQTMLRLFGECQGLGWVIVEAREWWLMTRCSSFSWSTFGANAKEQELHILDMWSGDPPTMSSSEYRRLLCHSEKRASFFLTSLFLLLPFHTILRLSVFLWQWTHWLWLARRPLNGAEKDHITEGRHLLDLVSFKTSKARATHTNKIRSFWLQKSNSR